MGKAMAPGPGSQVGPYKLQELLGRGALGEVYRAAHRQFRSRVALRILPPRTSADADIRFLFERNAQLAARLEHPNIARTHDIGDDQGYFYVATELCEGPTLHDLVRMRGWLSPDEALPLIAQLGSAVDYIHQSKLICGDLKPSNVIVEAGGHAKLIDLALIYGMRATEDRSSATRTSTIGTPAYMAPEIVTGELWSVSVDRDDATH
jgi:serine/threonine protein kinase